VSRQPEARGPERARWERLQALLDAVEALPEADRAGYLEGACPEDADLHAEVLALLAVEAEADAYLDGFARELASVGGGLPDLTGRRIGAYRLLRPLGRGGMGVVYEARRADGEFEQRVALKLLALALTGTEAHQRFLGERQILAGLEHPAIARVLDGGVTEDGTPWFAMEHVEGLPIDAYCDRRRLGVRERLGLLLQACEAVEHAHRRLVVHRDLKPANVLVADDGKVKLLDFGIAKLLDAQAAQAAPATRTALRLMTPAYASPEQVRGEPVTTASDVYQLGVLLYELLTGHRPYLLRHGGSGELERAVLEQVPMRLSAAVCREHVATGPIGTTTSVAAVCRSRRSSLARLRRRLRGDLDTIAFKALSKEPGRRYGSADRLAQDIRRHLDALPVLARRDTWIYRGRKLLERHTVGAVTAMIGLALAAGMAGFHTVSVQRERDVAQLERDRAQAERDRAQAAAAQAEQMSRFLTGLFRGADPREARGAELTARELLNRGVQQVDRVLAAQPELQAQMLQVLARTYLELGLYDAAEPLLDRALELVRNRVGADHPEHAAALGNLGMLRYRQGEYRRAEALLDEAVRILDTPAGLDAPALAEVLETLGQTYRSLGDHERSLATLERALTIRARATGEDSEPMATVLNSLGAVLIEAGDYERAEEVYERALAIHEREHGAEHPLVGAALQNLAFVRSAQGRTEGLEAMYRRGLAIQQRAHGPVHPKVGASLNNLGHFLAESGHHAEAIEVLSEALEVQSAALGPDHPDLAYVLVSLGDTQRAAGRLLEARQQYQRIVAVREAALPAQPFDSFLVYSLVRLGRVEAELGNDVASERASARALAMWRRAPEVVDPQLAPALLELGRWLVDRERCADAVPVLERAQRLQSARRRPAGAEDGELMGVLARCS
jgi:serine/threonine-protein kinase